MDSSDFIQVSDLRSLDKAIRKLGIEAIEGVENGVPVLTVTIGRTLFMATIHNQCLKLMYRLRESDQPGGVDFSNKWNMYNFMGTLIPFTDGYAMKHETLVSNGIVAGNLKDTLTCFAQSISKFQNEWFTLTT
ncbi:hypothetical protein DIE23_21645 [Burkholderia sp. Bp9143]|uniref:hypothetical protein n=1 Tax=Burkholderia sp. Bp9143 TaxID=2184574 RepID=UPI000F5AD40D|nr:hypothetical protein [Burkholderia sp. Bp9143]RQR29512.1 hypothetical protein DIE23_21645 [Burkholderia sp. Bp9143]